MVGLLCALGGCRKSSLAVPSGFEAAAVYASACARCHGASGRGDTPEGRALGARDLTGGAARGLSEAAIEHQIAVGGANMPGFRGALSDGEIRALARYVETLAQRR